MSANERDKKKYEAIAESMYNKHLQISNILNRYDVAGMTLN